MWQWDGKIGPTFILALGLAALTGLNYLTDGKAALAQNIAVIETKLVNLSWRFERIERKVDDLKR